MEPTTNNNSMKQGLLGGLAIVLVGTLAFFLTKNKDTASEQTLNPITPTNTGTQGTVAQTNNTGTPGTTKTLYRDGTYSAEGKYTSPGGADAINVTITLANDVITSSTFSGTPSNPISEKLQGAFKSGYQAQVVGKSIEGLNLTVVNGASLTTKSFTDTLEKIKAEAKI